MGDEQFFFYPGISCGSSVLESSSTQGQRKEEEKTYSTGSVEVGIASVCLIPFLGG